MADKKKKSDPLDDAIGTIKKLTEDPSEGSQLGVGKKITELLQYLGEKFPDAFTPQQPAQAPEDGGTMSPADKLFGG